MSRAGMLLAMPHTPTADSSGSPRPCAADLLQGPDGKTMPAREALLRICRDQGVEVWEADLRDIAGALRQEENRWHLYLNRDDSPARQLHTLAHTLGHFFLHARPGRTFVEGGIGESPMRATAAEDHAAAAFALGLLVPEALIRAQLPTSSPTEDDVLALAARCGISPLAAAMWLQSLGYTLHTPA